MVAYIKLELIIENNELSHNEKDFDGIKITTTKKDGNYITISFEDITDFQNREKVGKHLEDVLKDILKLNNIKEKDTCS